MFPFQAFFFDLDDTLADTYGQLVLAAHQDAAEAMVKKGFPLSVDETYRLRLEYHQKFPRETLEERFSLEFPEVMNDRIRNASYQAFFGREVPLSFVPFPSAHKLLKRLQQENIPSFLITSGIETTQQTKVHILKLEPFFREIVYAPSSHADCKQKSFSELIRRYQFDPSKVACVGNRLDSEILAGNRLGCYTIYLKQGEFAQLEPQNAEEEPQVVFDCFESFFSQWFTLK